MDQRTCLVRDGRIVDDEWAFTHDGEAAPGVIASLAAWQRQPERAGVWIEGDADADEVGRTVSAAPLVSRYGFRGELRAFGEVIPDLAAYMHRCGFNAFVLPNRRQAEVAIACIERMSDHYQASVRQPMPPFRDPVSRRP